MDRFNIYSSAIAVAISVILAQVDLMPTLTKRGIRPAKVFTLSFFIYLALQAVITGVIAFLLVRYVFSEGILDKGFFVTGVCAGFACYSLSKASLFKIESTEIGLKSLFDAFEKLLFNRIDRDAAVERMEAVNRISEKYSEEEVRQLIGFYLAETAVTNPTVRASVEAQLESLRLEHDLKVKRYTLSALLLNLAGPRFLEGLLKSKV